MPQTRFVTQKAFDMGLHPIVVINKIDRPGARADWVLNETFDLFDRLGATDEQLDFPIVYASGLNGYAGDNPDIRTGDMTPLFEAIVTHVPPPSVDRDAPFRMQISSLDYSSYTGVIGIGRIERGSISSNTPVKIIGRDGAVRSGRVLQIFKFLGLEKVEVDNAAAGDIISFTGIDPLYISDTLCDPSHVEALPSLSVDEPTMSMTFQVNNSPFAGREGKYVTSRQIKERLDRELIHNVALRVEEMDDPDKFKVSGRGELHLSVLIETMRREGYELGVSRPEVIYKEVDGETHEPYELVVLDLDEQHQGAVMERMGERKGELRNMVPDGKGRIRLEYLIPTRGLIGFQTEFMTLTSGSGLKFQTFDHYGPKKDGLGKTRHNGVLVSMATGKALAYALFNLQDRGRLFIGHGDEVYEGMVIGIHSRDNDLTVNPLKAKQLTNIRAAGSDENLILTPPIRNTLEQALEFIDDDELVEVTPKSIRIRKKYLTENERKRAKK
jgi:glutathione-disulfide reductase